MSNINAIFFRIIGMKLHRRNSLISSNILLFFIVCIGSFLRIYQLDNKGLWIDEIVEVIVAMRGNIPDVLSGASHHLSPPLDYIVLHFFLSLGNSDFIVRLPSVIFGIISIIFIYNIARTLFGVKEGFISAFLLSISPMHIWYSQEARMYSLFMLLSLVSLLFFIKAINGNNKLLWIGFIISTTLGIYTHYFSFFIILIYISFFCLMIFSRTFFTENHMFSKQINKTTIIYFSISILVIFLLYIPQIPVFLSQTGSFTNSLWYGLPPTLYFFEIIFYKMGPWNIPGLIVYLGFFICGLMQILKIEYKNQMQLLFLWIFIPIISSFILTYSRGEMTTERNFIFILPIIILIISKGIVIVSSFINHKIQSTNKGNSNNSIVNSIVILIITILIFSATLTDTTIDNLYNLKNKGDKDTGAYLTTHVKNNELIAIFQEGLDIEYYYRGNSKIVRINKNITGVYGLLNDSSIKKYNKIWFVHSEIDSGCYRGFNKNLSSWFDANCEVQQYPLLQERFRLSNVDKKIINWLNIEFVEDYQSTALYTFNLTNENI